MLRHQPLSHLNTGPVVLAILLFCASCTSAPTALGLDNRALDEGVSLTPQEQNLRCGNPGADLICMNTDAGRELIARSTYKEDFWLLGSTFTTQQTQTLCAVASAVSVLNTLPGDKPIDPVLYPHPYYTQTNYFNEAVSDVVAMAKVMETGMELAQLQDTLEAHGVSAVSHYASDRNVNQFRETLKRTLDSTTHFVISNFDRKAVDQEGAGHFSPLGAYDALSDRVLLLDVARYKYVPAWIPVQRMFDAMSSPDPGAKPPKSRGWLVVSAVDTKVR